jgi:hypothetical protein
MGVVVVVVAAADGGIWPRCRCRCGRCGRYCCCSMLLMMLSYVVVVVVGEAEMAV